MSFACAVTWACECCGCESGRGRQRGAVVALVVVCCASFNVLRTGICRRTGGRKAEREREGRREGERCIDR